MPTQPRTAAEHYAAAERLLGAADETPASAPLLALAHAVLAQAPRRARKPEQQPARHTTSDLPRSITWGDDERTDR